MSTTLAPKSTKENGKVYLWMMADVGGEFKAVCFEAKSVTEMLSDGYLAHASKHSRDQFVKAGIKKSSIILASS